MWTPKKKRPGRLEDAKVNLGTDPRTDPRLLPILKATRLSNNLPESRLKVGAASVAEMGALFQHSETVTAPLYEMPTDVAGDEAEPEVTCDEIDVNPDVKIYIWRKAGPQPKGKLPCVAYIHGGGMVITPARNGAQDRWCKSLVVAGVIAVTVDFRNACTTKSGQPVHNPFPAGLKDCCAAVQYLAANKETLGISTITLQGESGGGNLSLATALKAKREGWMAAIDGVYALAPYISGCYGQDESWLRENLPSVVENGGYLLSPSVMAVMVHYYTPEAANTTNPLAWPYHATAADLSGLPPHVIVVDELDPLRDEGLAFARKLTQAGVNVVTRVNIGVPHVAELLFRQALPELHQGVIDEIAAFARGHGRSRL